MKRARSVETLGFSRRWKWKLYHLLLAIAALYLLFISFKFRHFLQIATSLSGLDEDSFAGRLDRPFSSHSSDHDHDISSSSSSRRTDPQPIRPLRHRYGLLRASSTNLTELERVADEAWTLGSRAWDELEAPLETTTDLNQTTTLLGGGKTESCPSSASMANNRRYQVEGEEERLMMFLPCGLCVGSAITIVGRTLEAHEEFVPQLVKMGKGDGMVLVSQFMVELQGLKAVDGEDPPRIFHLNPRLRGDWSHRPVIEHNTCYRMQWGTAMRCDGLPSKDKDDTGTPT